MKRKQTVNLLLKSISEHPEPSGATEQHLGMAYTSGYDQAFKRLKLLVEQAKIMGRYSIMVTELEDIILDVMYEDFLEIEV